VTAETSRGIQYFMADIELDLQGRIIASGGIIAPAPAPWYTYTPAMTPFMSESEGTDNCGCLVPALCSVLQPC